LARSTTRAGRTAVALAAAGLALAPPLEAHVVYERVTLRQYLQESSLAVVAKIEGAGRLWTAPDGSDRREVFRARVREVLAGPQPPAAIEFFSHAEGLPGFRDGDRVLLFLERTEKRPEFTALAARFPYFTVQGPGAEWRLEGAAGEAVLAHARALVAVAQGAPDTVVPRLRALVLSALASPSAALRADARAELVVQGDTPGFLCDPAEFAALAGDPGWPLHERVALVRLLEARPGFDAASTWGLLREAAQTTPDRIALVRAGATSSDSAQVAWTAALLVDPDPRVRREAALALGRGRRVERVPELARACADPDERVARAAIEALAAVGGFGARQALAAVESGESGAPRGRWAAAALRRLD
jgi:HEAT repeats